MPLGLITRTIARAWRGEDLALAGALGTAFFFVTAFFAAGFFLTGVFFLTALTAQFPLSFGHPGFPPRTDGSYYSL